MSEAFKDTTDQLAKSAKAFEDGNKKANKSYQDWKDKLDKQKADRLKAQKDNNGGLPPGYSDKATYPSKEKAKKEKGYEFLQDKLKEFNTAGQAYASSLAGVFSQMGDVFDQFSGKAAEGLTKSLEKLSEPLTSLFDQNTGEWDDSLQPILAVFNEIGEVVGTSIVDGVNTVVEAVKEFGSYLDEDQTILNTMESVWSGISDVLSSIIGIVGTIFGVIGDIVGGIMNALGLTSQTGEELTGWQKAMLLVNGAAQGLAVIFAGLKNNAKSHKQMRKKTQVNKWLYII